MDGIGPADLHITSLVERVEQEPIREIIFALSATIEGDTTGYYIFKKMKNKKISSSAPLPKASLSAMIWNIPTS